MGCVVPSVTKWNVVRYWRSQVLSLHTPSSSLKYTYWVKMKVVVTHHSSKVTVHSSTSVQLTVTLIAPIAMDEGLRFAIREGGRTVGAGVVAKKKNQNKQTTRDDKKEGARTTT